MTRTAEEAAEIRIAEHPLVAECLGEWAMAGVRYALVGSQAASLAGLMLDIPDLKEPDDWDFQVHSDDFKLAVDCAKADVEWNETFKIKTGDNKWMRFTADNARATVGNTTIQFMRLHGPVRIGARTFDTTFTSEAHAASRRYGHLQVAHDTESIMLYGLRQGGDTMKKQDMLRAAAIRAVRDPATESYAGFRARQGNWDARLRTFDAAAARQAARFQRQALLVAA